MQEIMDLYMEGIWNEKESFWLYIKMYNKEPMDDRKTVWKAIAADELDHLTKLKERIWYKLEDCSIMEKAFYHAIQEEIECMHKTLKELR